MKKVILVDGNNLMFRSYYATAYTGNMMKNSKNFPTNALYGFMNMMNKIIAEEKPEYIAVAFDIGVNFRKLKYSTYKDGRAETPKELKMQMPKAKELLKAMGIKYYELEPYEADDIIGTLAKMANLDSEYDATIISSDRDLLQLVTDIVDIKLLKQHDYIRYNPKMFKEDYGIDPIKVIDLKGLAGDTSDNIPGVKGIGEKTALSLLKDYGSLEGIYENIEKIKGKTKEKLLNDRDNAFMSKEMATIYNDVPLNITLDDTRYDGPNKSKLYEMLEDLEFYSMLKSEDKPRKALDENYEVITDIKNLQLASEVALYIECDKSNYHLANIIGVSLADKNGTYYLESSLLKDLIPLLEGKTIYTFDHKKNLVLLNRLGIPYYNVNFDMMIAAYLLNYNIKDDISYLMRPAGYDISFYEDIITSENKNTLISMKAKFILENRDKYIELIKNDQMYELFRDIEMPLIEVLADMEITGVKVNLNTLNEMKEEIKSKLDKVSEEIYELSGERFNIASPRQLSVILFEKLGLPYGKKLPKGGYKSDVKILHKLLGKHPIIPKIMEHRNLSKLYSTYLDGFTKYIHEDGLVHTIYNQCLTRTGRLSSIEPNMQNIPTRDSEGKRIKKAFVPQNDYFLSCDYSQIELRLVAHISNSKEMIEAFNNDLDIHTKVAADIYGIPEENITKEERSTAKAVIFGIIYGISGFGLGENLEISARDAKVFIDKYLELYPGVKTYMDEIVKEAYEEGCVRTLFNRKRVIEELNNANYMVRSSGERIAMNTPIQGTAADIIKKAMVEVYEEFKKQNIQSKIVVQVHDELVLDVLESEKDKVLKIVTDKMENVYKISVPLKVSSSFGKDWYEAK